MGVLDAMPSSNLKPENEDAVRVLLILFFAAFVFQFCCGILLLTSLLFFSSMHLQNYLLLCAVVELICDLKLIWCL